MSSSNKFRTSINLAAALFAIGTAVALPSAAQADRKIFPGTICQVWGGSATSAISYSQFGRVINESATNRLGVVCPLVRDNTGSAPNWIRIYYNDEHFHGGNNGVLSCRVRANNVWGEASSDSQGASTSGSGGTSSGVWTYYSIDNTSNGGAYQESNYTVFCLIPPTEPGSGHTSFIGSIVLDE